MENFIREKKIYCGDFLEVDIIPMSKIRLQKRKRGKKKKISAPKQKNLNDKNAKRYFRQLINTNFTKKDLHVTLTYDDENLPTTLEEGEKNIRNFLRRVKREIDKIEKELKYILVTEYAVDEEENLKQGVRLHHHLILNEGLDRDKIESLWSKRKKKGEKEGERYGFVNADRLQPDEKGLEALAQYLTKNPNRKKRWSSSKNLKKPVMTHNDSKYTRRKVEQLAHDPEDRQYWEKKYPGYTLTECEPKYNQETGWSIYLKMRKNSKDKNT